MADNKKDKKINIGDKVIRKIFHGAFEDGILMGFFDSLSINGQSENVSLNSILFLMKHCRKKKIQKAIKKYYKTIGKEVLWP